MVALSAFAELGLNASSNDISSRAHVGFDTLSRRFPAKHALIDAVFEEHLRHIAAAAEYAVTPIDPWDGSVG